MATVVRKGLAGKDDIRWYTSASPTFYRMTSSGGATTLTAVPFYASGTPASGVQATYVNTTQSAASRYWSQNTVQRALNEGISRYFQKNHSIATYTGGGGVGDHNKVFGFKNAAVATSIQAAASNHYKTDGFARIVIPEGTTTAATPINLPRKCWIFGNGRGTIIRASSTVQTSRVFSISGSLAATTSNLNANATVGTQNVSVVDGSKFTKGQWILVEDSINKELQQILSISSNTLTTCGRLTQTYRSAATTKKATLVYPAELVMDNMDIQLTSATQGMGVAATYLVRSVFGPNLRIQGAANQGIMLSTSSDNEVDAQISYPSSNGAGKGYGVRVSNYSRDNRIGGVRNGTTKDVADTRSPTNWIHGVHRTSSSVASGCADMTAMIYRNNKPELSWGTYGATTAVLCYGSSDAPAEVYMNGRLYRNSGTVVCDISRTKTPVTATIGGLDRGPALATYMHHAYAVPSMFSTATRQWDLMCSTQGPATGPLASSTWPVWSYLGCVPVAQATLAVTKFYQDKDITEWGRPSVSIFEDLSPVAAQATFRELTCALIPNGAKAAKLYVRCEQPSVAPLSSAYGFRVGPGWGTNLNHQTMLLVFSDTVSGSAVSLRQSLYGQEWFPLNSMRNFAYQVSNAATYDAEIFITGIRMPRAKYK